MSRTRRVRDKVDSRVISLCMRFHEHLATFTNAPAFTRHQRKAHLTTLNRRRELGSVNQVLEDGEFFHALRKTLRLWDMDQRRAKLGSEHDWLETFYRHTDTLERLWRQRLDDPGLDIQATAADAWSILREGRFMASKSQLVGGTKVLHHLLPDLIPPIDRRYTCSFFQWHDPQVQDHPWDVFSDILAHYHRIARDVEPEQYVGEDWNSSVTKVIDNAIVGYQINT